MTRLLKRIHAFLLPQAEELKFAPYVWLIYLSIFLFSLANYHRGEYAYWYSSLGIALFLLFYFHGYWATSQKVIWNIVSISIIGTLLAMITPGASVFFVYAAAFCCRLGNPRKASIGLAGITAWILLFSWLTSQSPYFMVPGVIFTLMIGGMNIYQHELGKKRRELNLSREEIRTLAKTAERERIARDLHDLIGHTFSVISLKAELAEKLLDKDLDRARQEILQLAGISRDALKQIREVVTGYRTSDLTTELAHAKYVLESNEIQFRYQLDDFEMRETLNKELAIILKELVTNILKHANASQVHAIIKKERDTAILEVKDNGGGIVKQPTQGYGLQGIRERLDKLAGSFSIDSAEGLTIVVRVPLEEVQ